MAVGTQVGSFQEHTFLVHFGLKSVELLMLDDLWTLAVTQRDPEAADIGRRMNTLMEQLGEQSNRVTELIESNRSVLSDGWPSMSESWQLSQEQREALDGYIEERGGLGAAGVQFAAELRDSLVDESEVLAAKIAELETHGHTTVDISRLRKMMIAVVAICVFAVPAIAVGAVAGGVLTVGLALVTGGMAEAGIVGGIAGSLILAS